MKKSLLIVGGIFLSIIIYLVVVYPSIYYRIGQGNLPFLDVKPMYKFNENLSSEKIIYVAMGDSLTYGAGVDNFSDAYPYLIAKKIAGENQSVTLFPLAFPGYKSTDLTGNLLSSAIAAKPNIVTIMIGVNDIHSQVSLSDFEQNYQLIINDLKTKTTAKIYLISLPFIGDSSLMPPPYQQYFISKTTEFNESIKKLAEKNQIEFIDITSDTIETFKKPGDHYSKDHFHPSALGYKLFEQSIYEHLR
jgi:lysophospholipase L1-like esterase